MSDAPSSIRAYAALSQGSTPELWQYEPRMPRADDVSIEILYCGVCHSDIHFVENDWGMSEYPVVPGHEIIGRVTAAGPDAGRFQVGDLVGVGCVVDSCRECSSCDKGLEQYCAGGVWTYNGVDRHDGKVTYGGYSERILVSERFVLSVPDQLDPAAAAPLLCAGITTYSPLRHVGVKAGDKVGVIGMGGLGHMGIKFAKAMGAEVTLFTRSESKVEEGKRHGVDHVVISTDEEQMQQAAGSLLHFGYGAGGARLQPLHQLLGRRRHAHAGRSVDSNRASTRSHGPNSRPPLHHGLRGGWYSRNPRDARFLCRARHFLRCGNDQDAGHWRSLREDEEGGCALSLCD